MFYTDEAYTRRSGAAASPRVDDARSPFAKDRDRLLYSNAFRRLAGKSQVVASTEIGPFHTRLTHSLKVAQLGRRLAEQLRPTPAGTGTTPASSTTPQLLAPDPDLVEFACLAHDLGHPPFGHTGERALHKTVDRLVGQAVENYLKAAGMNPGANQASEAQRIIGGFEGNPQSFRIVTRLAHKAFPAEERLNRDIDRFIGLDLTAAAIDAVSKYPWGRERLVENKWGAYGAADDEQSDYATLLRARTETGAAARPDSDRYKRSFECQLMDWCDDVTYAVHDVEDFYMIGMIPLDRIFGTALRDDEQIKALGQPAGRESGSPQRPQALVTDEWLAFQQHLQDKWDGQKDFLGEPRQTDAEFLDTLRSGLIDAYGTAGWEAAPGSIQARRFSHRRTSNLIKHFASANVGAKGEPLLHSGSLQLDLPVTYRPDVSERDLRYQCDLLKELIWKYVIGLPGLQTQQAGQERIIVDLVETYASDIDLLPPHYREVVEEGSGFAGIAEVQLPDGCLKRLAEIRAAADYVASLTEPQALALHKRLTGVSLGGFRDFV